MLPEGALSPNNCLNTTLQKHWSIVESNSRDRGCPKQTDTMGRGAFRDGISDKKGLEALGTPLQASR
jgi:hypothetical protein